MHPALLYDILEDKAVRCRLCRHECVIKDGKTGQCHVRQNRDGALYSLVYRRIIAENVDPIEKKPLFHVHPGSKSYSVATVGCNFRCRHCQNADIAQMPRDNGRIMGDETTPQAVVARAVQSGCRTIAHTYTEPTIFFETALEIARLSTENGLDTVFVTNGYMSDAALEAIHPHLRAANVDLKSFSDDFYRHQCGARLQGVLDTLTTMKRMGIWVEVTTLVIPTLNDDPAELRDLARFVAGLGPETPWHVSRFFPRYRQTDLPPTPVETILEARRIGLEAGLRYVYAGNLHDGQGEDTLCHHCGLRLIRRVGYLVRDNSVVDGRCPQCNTAAAGIGLSR